MAGNFFMSRHIFRTSLLRLVCGIRGAVASDLSRFHESRNGHFAGSMFRIAVMRQPSPVRTAKKVLHIFRSAAPLRPLIS